MTSVRIEEYFPPFCSKYTVDLSLTKLP